MTPHPLAGLQQKARAFLGTYIDPEGEPGRRTVAYYLRSELPPLLMNEVTWSTKLMEHKLEMLKPNPEAYLTPQASKERQLMLLQYMNDDLGLDMERVHAKAACWKDIHEGMNALERIEALGTDRASIIGSPRLQSDSYAVSKLGKRFAQTVEGIADHTYDIPTADVDTLKDYIRVMPIIATAYQQHFGRAQQQAVS